MRGQSVKKLAQWTLAASLAVVGLAGCSSSEEDEENLEASNGNQGNLGEDDAAEGNGQENFVDSGEGDQGGGAAGADVNSDTGTDTAGALDTTLNGTGQNPTAPTNAAAQAPVNPAPANAAAAAAPAAAPAPAAPAAQAGTAPVPGGRVRYVPEGGVQVVNGPNGSPVTTLEQGEHPVTWEENGWLRITSGMYVPVDALSDKGVPRPRAAGNQALAH